MNLPNYITLSRIAAVPLIIWILTTSYFSAKEQTLRVVLASGLFILASITDGLDGYLARRRGQITTMGMLLDPLADKLMIAACYITLVHLIPEIVNVWVVVLIIGREFLISGLRSIASAEGFTIEASELGKLKMMNLMKHSSFVITPQKMICSPSLTCSFILHQLLQRLE